MDVQLLVPFKNRFLQKQKKKRRKDKSYKICTYINKSMEKTKTESAVIVHVPVSLQNLLALLLRNLLDRFKKKKAGAECLVASLVPTV